MAGDWREVTLDEISEEITVGHVGLMADRYVDIGVPFLRSLNVVPFGIDTRDLKYIPNDFHARLRKSALKPGDVVIVRTGKPGACAVIPNWLVEANCSDLVIVRVGRQARPEYISYVVNSTAAHHINAHTVGAVQQHFNVGSARVFRFMLPSLVEQDRILRLLSALDQKIRLNRNMAESLETMGMSVFKSWFVDFDPVRANAEGRRTGLPDDFAALFPDTFGENGLPIGWANRELLEEFTVIMGQSPPGSTYNEKGEGLPFFQGNTDFGFRFPSRRVFCTAPARIAMPGDTLVSVRAPVGDINMAEEKCCLGRGVAALRHKSDSSTYTYYAIKNLHADIASFDHDGTIFGAINKKQLEALTVLAPASKIISAFNSRLEPLDLRIGLALRQASTLAELRDTILPGLISGELRITDAEKRIAAA
jgi:type I restriction enzyme S subunit